MKKKKWSVSGWAQTVKAKETKILSLFYSSIAYDKEKKNCKKKLQKINTRGCKAKEKKKRKTTQGVIRFAEAMRSSVSALEQMPSKQLANKKGMKGGVLPCGFAMRFSTPATITNAKQATHRLIGDEGGCAARWLYNEIQHTCYHNKCQASNSPAYRG